MNNKRDPQLNDPFAAFLRTHDPIVPPSLETLSNLESRILARAADARPHVPAGIGWWPGMVEQPWAMRSAGLLAVLTLVLGIAAGNDFSGGASNTSETPTTYVASAGTPWQSFITTASLGDTDDATDDTADDDSE